MSEAPKPKAYPLRVSTLCVHGDHGAEPGVKDVAPPLHVSTTFVRLTPQEQQAREQERQQHDATWGRACRARLSASPATDETPAPAWDWRQHTPTDYSLASASDKKHDSEAPAPESLQAGGPAPEMAYARDDQPTRARLERILGALEGGVALTYASGLAAISAVLHHVKPRRVAMQAGYFATRATNDLFRHAAYGATAALPPPRRNTGGGGGDDDDAAASQAAAAAVAAATAARRPISLEDLRAELDAGGDGVDLILVETPRNPDTRLVDVVECVALAARCRPRRALVVVDSTFASPIGLQPLALGADVVMHSATKILGGHSDTLGGVLVVRDAERADEFARERMLLGNVLGTMESWLLLRSVRTLELRVRRAGESALAVARWLEARIGAPDAATTASPVARITRVWHCHLESHPDHAIARRQLHVPPYCFAFELGEVEHAVHLGEHTRLFGNATSLGGCESLLDYRRRWDADVSPYLVRISIGLEDVEDLTADLEAALQAVAVKYSVGKV